MTLYQKPTGAKQRGSKDKGASRNPVTPQQKWVRGCVVTFGVFVFLCYAVAGLLRQQRKREFRDSPPQRGIATVSTIVPPTNFEGGLKQEGDGFINVRFRGGLYKVNSVRNFAQLHENQTVQIFYRVSKRGDVAVDSAEPLSVSSDEQPPTP